MPRTVSLNELIDMVHSIKNFEVLDYQDDSIVVDDVKGIVKIKDGISKEELGELRKRRPRGKPTNRQLEVTEQVVNRLVSGRVKFKVVFGPREVTIRFDLDHYVRITDKDVRVVGFTSKDEGALGLISNVLEGYGPLVFLRRVQ
ncbi:hypothetical protein [Vulcanisaeta thermophila]|uniref:hypothetical protein n=1 Tax=Vulcanisaeta thermophila TaxID=867917 RepID=UPI000852E679|nr:hypothetical protein [Vulcanisaeta thermophila]